MNADEQFVLTKKEGSTVVLTLNRPSMRNAINAGMLDALADALSGARSDESTQVVVITGADGHFSAGADISVLAPSAPSEVRRLALAAVETYERVETLGKPVIAAIDGYALGGGLELAEACTLRMASTRAVLGHPEVRIGAVAGWGGTTRLARLVGRGRAAAMLLTGKTIPAAEALEVGLVNEVVDVDALLPRALALASEIASHSWLAGRLTCEALQRGLDLTIGASARVGADAFGLVAAGDEFKEGTRAFLEKRSPTFKRVVK